jgi:hypothetical protein
LVEIKRLDEALNVFVRGEADITFGFQLVAGCASELVMFASLRDVAEVNMEGLFRERLLGRGFDQLVRVWVCVVAFAPPRYERVLVDQFEYGARRQRYLIIFENLTNIVVV